MHAEGQREPTDERDVDFKERRGTELAELSNATSGADRVGRFSA